MRQHTSAYVSLLFEQLDAVEQAVLSAYVSICVSIRQHTSPEGRLWLLGSAWPSARTASCLMEPGSTDATSCRTCEQARLRRPSRCAPRMCACFSSSWTLLSRLYSRHNDASSKSTAISGSSLVEQEVSAEALRADECRGRGSRRVPRQWKQVSAEAVEAVSVSLPAVSVSVSVSLQAVSS